MGAAPYTDTLKIHNQFRRFLEKNQVGSHSSACDGLTGNNHFDAPVLARPEFFGSPLRATQDDQADAKPPARYPPTPCCRSKENRRIGRARFVSSPKLTRSLPRFQALRAS